jgi:hypothetical protein
MTLAPLTRAPSLALSTAVTVAFGAGLNTAQADNAIVEVRARRQGAPD